jgi:hypothetical protein
MTHGVAMAMKNGFGKCCEIFEQGAPDNMAMCSPSDEATRLGGIFSWGKTLPWIGMASPFQKNLQKPVFLWRVALPHHSTNFESL